MAVAAEISPEALRVWAGVELECSTPIPHNFAAQLTELDTVSEGPVGEYRWSLETEAYYFGLHWEDHVEVLKSLIADVRPALAEIARSITSVNFFIYWVGAKGVEPPQPALNLLSDILVPGARFDVRARWDEGWREGEAAYAGLNVYGETLDFDALNEFFGPATHFFAKGDLVSPQRSDARWRHGYWTYTTDGEISSMRVDDHLDALFRHLGEPTAAWREYIKKNGLEVSISVFWLGEPGAVAPFPPYDTLRKVALYGAVYSHDAYSFHD